MVSQLDSHLSKDSDPAEPKFRLWLTAELRSKFPVSLIKRCVKFVMQVPNRLKVNVNRSFTSLQPTYQIGTKNVFKLQAFLLLSWFHGLILEQKNFIPLGWSKEYEFGMGDLRMGAQILEV